MKAPIVWLTGLISSIFIANVTIASPVLVSPESTSPESTVLEENPTPDWTLKWEEDFSGSTLDDSTWTRIERGTAPWNDTMSDDSRLLKLQDGVLQLWGMVNEQPDLDPAPFITAGVTSKGKFTFQYGKVQIRARFSSAQGAWPALWMLGSDKVWPAKGEIDLMEHLNFDRKVYQTVHSEYTVKIDQTDTPKRTGIASINPDDWNTYGCEWDANTIIFTVNGEPTHTYPRVPEKGPEQWPFDQDFYLMLTMQIGGPWVNSYGESNPEHYPAHMEVDWIRVFDRETPDRKSTNLLPSGES